jgi:hypothetical protein
LKPKTQFTTSLFNPFGNSHNTIDIPVSLPHQQASRVRHKTAAEINEQECAASVTQLPLCCRLKPAQMEDQ